MSYNQVMLIDLEEITQEEYMKASGGKNLITQVMPHGFVTSDGKGGRTAWLMHRHDNRNRWYRGELSTTYPLDSFINFKLREVQHKLTAVFDNPNPPYMGANSEPREAIAKRATTGRAK